MSLWKIAAAIFLGLTGAAHAQAVVSGVPQTVVDPCQGQTRTYSLINIVTAANTKIVTGTASKKTYICHIFMLAGAADNVAVIEGSGTNCATSPLALIGGNTAAKGLILAANEGLVEGDGSRAIAATTVNANDFCLITSAAVQLSGVAVTVQQ